MSEEIASNIESRLDSTDGIREKLIDALMVSSDSIDVLVKDKDAMINLTTLLRDRDSTNSKRLRISADKEMAKKNGEEALEIANMILENKRKRREEIEQNPEEHQARRTVNKADLPDIEITDELTHVGVTDLSLDKFITNYESERGITGRR